VRNDTIGATVRVPIILHIKNGVLPSGDLAIHFDTAMLDYQGTFTRDGKAMDVSRSPGHASLHFDGGGTSDTIGYATFRVFPSYDSCTTVTFDSLQFGSDCATLSNASVTVCSIVGCGIPTLSRFVRYGKMSLSIVPNPTGGNVELRITNEKLGIGDVSLSVVDALGKEIFSTHTLNPIPYTLPTTGWSSGIYFVRVTTPQGSVTGSFVKE
jgi:hypothetical protein